MRLRIVYHVKSICEYVNLFRNTFGARSYKYVLMIVHAIILLEGQINCLRISQQWYEKVAAQRISDFLNQGKIDIRSLNSKRIKHLIELAVKHPHNQDILGEYLLFSIDASDFKKYKRKKSQGVRWGGDGKNKYLTHSFVLSSFIYGESTIPFKKSLYWGKKSGKKRPTKAQIYLKLARKATKWLKSDKQGIVVMDGEGCNKEILKAIHENKAWAGFVTKFPRTHNLITQVATLVDKKEARP